MRRFEGRHFDVTDGPVQKDAAIENDLAAQKDRALRDLDVLRSDGDLRSIVFAVPGLVSNLVFAVFNLLVALSSRAAWPACMSGYYLLLGMTRILVVGEDARGRRGDWAQEQVGIEWNAYRRGSAAMLGMAVLLVPMAWLLLNEEGGRTYPGIMIYVAAAYAFYRIAMSIVGVVRASRMSSLVTQVLRRLNLLDSCVSMLALQTALFAAFGGNAACEALQNAGVALAVALLACVMGVRGLVVARNKALLDRPECRD